MVPYAVPVKARPTQRGRWPPEPLCRCRASVWWQDVGKALTNFDNASRDRLRTALLNAPLRLAVLFGSQATGRGRPGSDFDVGIIPLDPQMPLHDELALAAALSGAVSAEVDLVRLDGDAPLLGAEVARTGVCLFEAAPGVFSAYRAAAISRWIDFEAAVAPHRARFLRRLVEARR